MITRLFLSSLALSFALLGPACDIDADPLNTSGKQLLQARSGSTLDPVVEIQHGDIEELPTVVDRLPVPFSQRK